MNKSIVVINTPKNCRVCPFRESPWSFCLGEYEKEKHCPLKPLPEKMKVNYDFIALCEVTEKVVAMGWNACIETILGEEE